MVEDLDGTFVSNQREIPQPVGYIKIEKFQPFGIWKPENVNVINHSFNSAKLLLEPKIIEKIVKIELLFQERIFARWYIFERLPEKNFIVKNFTFVQEPSRKK